MTQRGSIVPAIALIFGAAVVVTIFGYMLWPKDEEIVTTSSLNMNAIQAARNSNLNAATNSNTNAATNTNTVVDPTAGWKTYTNSALKYSYRYPGDFKTNECTNGGVPEYSFVSEDGVPCGTEWFGNGFGFSKQSSAYKQSETIAQTQAAIQNPITSTVTIDGMAATRVRGVLRADNDMMGGGNRYSDYVFLTKDGIGYIINNLSLTTSAYRQGDFETFLGTIDFSQ